MFTPGMLVVCVDISMPADALSPTGAWAYPPEWVRKGAVYTIRAVGPAPTWAHHLGDTSVWLAELRLPDSSWWNGEPGIRSARFRPLKDSVLDVFRTALEPAPKQTEPA